MPFMFDGARQLLRNEHQDFFFFLAKPDVRGVTLDYNHSEDMVRDLQRNSEPIERRRANEFNLARGHQASPSTSSALSAFIA